MRKHQLTQRRRRKRITEHKWQVRGDPHDTSKPMSSNSMHVHAMVVDLKVQPLERERLHQAEDALAQERIQPDPRAGLEQDRQDAVPEHQRHERIRALRAVFNIDRGIEAQVSIRKALPGRPRGASGAAHPDPAEVAQRVDRDRDPDQRQLRRVADMDGRDPQHGAERHHQGLEDDGAPDHGDDVGQPRVVQGAHEAIGQIERHHRDVRVRRRAGRVFLERVGDVRRVPEQIAQVEADRDFLHDVVSLKPGHHHHH